MRTKVTKAIIPVAGLGTQFLPATKSVPKELMPLVDRPLVQYAIDEARASGIKEFIFVTSRGKSALEDYFDNASQLERILQKKGKKDLLRIIKATDMTSGEIAYVRQNKPLGLGHAIWCARRLISNEPFAVILPDDVIAADKPCLGQMMEAFDNIQSNIVAVMEMPLDETSNYGILDVKEDVGSIVSINGIVEKPQNHIAPSNLAIIGRYILTPTVMKNLHERKSNVDGEVQLTDAIVGTLEDSENVYGFRFEGQRFDCGSKAGYLRACIAFSLSSNELRDDFYNFLRELVYSSKAAE